jgi:hypothetical protein
MREITFKNLDIIHFAMTPFLFEPGENMRLENVTVENIRIHGEGQAELIRVKPVINHYMRKKVPGFIQDVRFKNLTLVGTQGAYRIEVAGADSDHGVRRAAFEGVSISGAAVTRDSPQVLCGPHVSEVFFMPPSGVTAPATNPAADEPISSP